LLYFADLYIVNKTKNNFDYVHESISILIYFGANRQDNEVNYSFIVQNGRNGKFCAGINKVLECAWSEEVKKLIKEFYYNAIVGYIDGKHYTVGTPEHRKFNGNTYYGFLTLGGVKEQHNISFTAYRGGDVDGYWFSLKKEISANYADDELLVADIAAKRAIYIDVNASDHTVQFWRIRYGEDSLISLLKNNGFVEGRDFAIESTLELGADATYFVDAAVASLFRDYDIIVWDNVDIQVIDKKVVTNLRTMEVPKDTIFFRTF